MNHGLLSPIIDIRRIPPSQIKSVSTSTLYNCAVIRVMMPVMLGTIVLEAINLVLYSFTQNDIKDRRFG